MFCEPHCDSGLPLSLLVFAAIVLSIVYLHQVPMLLPTDLGILVILINALRIIHYFPQRFFSFNMHFALLPPQFHVQKAILQAEHPMSLEQHFADLEEP